jgi:SNF2 family DNA or RNA helicase
MTCEISVTPDGRLLLSEPVSSESRPTESWLKNIADAFSTGAASGLFALAAMKLEGHAVPSVSYWREFSSRYLTELCKLPQFSLNGGELTPIDPPALPQLETVLLSVPPMRGAEYLNVEMLSSLWRDLDDWVRREIATCNGGLGAWLNQNAPLWHQVGRVCFHLAENKRDDQYPFAFLVTYAPKVSSGGRVQYQPLARALQEHAGDRNKKALINLLSPVHLASEKSAFVRELVESNDIFHPLMWTPADAYRFLKEVPLLEESGLLVRLPDWWRKRQRPRVTVTIGEKKQNHLKLDAMLDFQVKLALGDAHLTSEELRQIMSSKEGLVYLKGQWIEVDRERLSEALAHWKTVEQEAAAGGISFIEGMRLLAGTSAGLDTDGAFSNNQDRQWSFVDAGTWLKDVLAGLRDPNQLFKRKLSKDFCGTLRPYQQAGHDWLRFVSSLGLGACLADDMGLGKTVQILSLLLSIKEEGKLPARPSLLVLPASLLGNWKAEMERFAPTLSACFIHPSESEVGEISTIAAKPEKALASLDVVATTYGMLLRHGWLLDMEWRLVILDEAQAIKNPSARQSRAVKKLKSEARLALTGTPVENRLSDLWSLFDFLSPGLLGSAEKFKRFVKALDDREDQSYAPLRNLVSPYILRRLKTDKSIISDLPDKTETKVFCGLAPEQAALYARSVDELKHTLKTVEGIKRRGLVLSYLLRFKQICNHPSQLSGDGEFDPGKSGKFDRLKAICDEIASRQERVLVFTQFREMTEPIAAFLAELFGQPGLVLHGGTAVARRKGIVDTFQQVGGPPFVVLSLKAGGTGLNLTAASHVVHFDRWWNPAVENQATDRAYRIGQHRNVLVHKFVCRGTIEEKIDKLISEKTELSEEILTGGAENVLTEMSDKDLLNIVSLDLDRVSLE